MKVLKKSTAQPQGQGQHQQHDVQIGSGTPRIIHHQNFEKKQSIAARSISNSIGEDLRTQEIWKYINAINNDSKGEAKDSLGYPEIANTIIKLGKYIRHNDVSGVDRIIITAMNKLVFNFLNDTHFISRGEKCKLWAVHVDIIWLAHEMRKKNLNEIQLLEESTQQTIFQIRALRIEGPMHPLLSHNFNAIKTLWQTDVNDSAARRSQENFGKEQFLAKRTKEFDKQLQVAKDKAKEELEAAQKRKKELEAEVKALNEKSEALSVEFKKLGKLYEEANKELQKLMAENGKLIKLNTEIKEGNEKLVKSKEEVTQQSQVIETKNTELEAVKKELETMIKQREEALAKLKEESDKLKAKNNDLMREAKEKLVISEAEIRKLNEKSEALCVVYNQQLQTFNTETKAAKDQLEELKTQILAGSEALDKLENTSKQLEEKNTRLQEDQEKAKKELEAAEIRKNESKIEVEKLTNALEVLHEQYKQEEKLKAKTQEVLIIRQLEQEGAAISKEPKRRKDEEKTPKNQNIQKVRNPQQQVLYEAYLKNLESSQNKENKENSTNQKGHKPNNGQQILRPSNLNSNLAKVNVFQEIE